MMSEEFVLFVKSINYDQNSRGQDIKNELEDQIDAKKEVLIDEIQKRLEAQSQVQELFTIQWKIV